MAKPLKILVTGGCGFIGSALVRTILRTTPHHVLNLDKLTYAATPEAVVVPTGAEGRYEHSLTDVCDAPAVRAMMQHYRPDVVIHLAAESHVDRSIDEPAAFMETNIIGTYVMLEAARHHWEGSRSRDEDFKFLHVSTDEVFGDLDRDEEPFRETTPYRPNSPYSASKASSDLIARAWNKTFGLPVIISNCSNNYGPWQAPEKLIPVVITKLSALEAVPVYGDGMNIRDWLHVDDHAEALMAIVSRGKAGERYNIGGKSEIANIDLVKTICKIMDGRRPNNAPHTRLISFVTDRKGHDRRYAVDVRHIEREIGWSPRRQFEQAVGETVDWYLQNHDWSQKALKKLVDA